MPVSPMLCRSTDLDELARIALAGEGWILEPKYDGERIIAERKGGVISLWTRREKDAAYQFPEIVEALRDALPPADWVVDGELTVGGGFGSLVSRNTGEPLRIAILSRKTPATLRLFDVIRAEGSDLAGLQLTRRKELQNGMLKASERVVSVPCEPLADPAGVFERLTRAGTEGLVAKRLDSPYEPVRSRWWLKVKKSDTVDVEVIGVTRSDALPFGALVLARDGKYFGKVGSGFTESERSRLLAILRSKGRPPSRADLPPDVKADLLFETEPFPAEVRVQELLPDGHPRAPVWVRLRWQ